MKSAVKNALSFVKEYFKKDASGHDYYHTLRVYENAVKIAEKEKADIELTALIALLHDVDDCKLVGDNGKYFINTKAFLKANHIEESNIHLICSEISKISFQGTGTHIPETLEGKIAQDADRLDAIGAIGIARTFAYGGNKNRPIYLPDDEEHISSVSHFYDKLLKLKDLMNTDSAKEIALQRHRYTEKFLQEFNDEINGIK